MKPNQSKHVRIKSDLAVMLAAIARDRYQTSADVLDPLVRHWIEAEFRTLPKAVRERATTKRRIK